MSVYYSEFLFAFSFSFKQRVILSSSLLVSTVSSTLSFHSPFLFLFHSFFFFLHLFLFWRSIVTPYTLSLTFSLSSRQRARQISNPHSQFMTLFFIFFPLNWLVLLIRTFARNSLILYLVVLTRKHSICS